MYFIKWRPHLFGKKCEGYNFTLKLGCYRTIYKASGQKLTFDWALLSGVCLIWLFWRNLQQTARFGASIITKLNPISAHWCKLWQNDFAKKQLLLFLFDSLLQILFQFVGHFGVLHLYEHRSRPITDTRNGRIWDTNKLNVVPSLQERHL